MPGKKIPYGVAVKTPSPNAIEKQPYAKARQKNIIRNDVHNTVEKSLSKSPYQKARRQSTLQKSCLDTQ